MKKVMVIGAGKSSFYLLNYLAQQAAKQQIHLHVTDSSAELLQVWVGLPGVSTQILNIENRIELANSMQEVNVVVSLLPPALHPIIANICVEKGIHLATASYVSDEMHALNEAAINKGITLLNELGLDPGLDHLSAMKAMDGIRAKGGTITHFESYCGGLIAEEDCIGNPWKYKFSWNPKNVVLAGQGGSAMFKRNGALQAISPVRLFASAETLTIPNIGTFDAYANRDSLHYTKLYQLQSAKTVYRSTLRRQHFCKAWHVLSYFGFNSENLVLPDDIQSFAELCGMLTGWQQKETFGNYLFQQKIIESELITHFDFLLTENTNRNNEKSAAELLQSHLVKIWALQPTDKDEVIMYHKIKYILNGTEHTLHSTLHILGVDNQHTAMAKTVGLPLAMGVEMLLAGLTKPGVQIPLEANFYNFILPKLETDFNIHFQEWEGT